VTINRHHPRAFILWKSLGSLYYPHFCSGNLKWPLWLLRERKGGERDFDLSGHLNNEDVGTPLWGCRTSGQIFVSHVLVVVVICLYYLYLLVSFPISFLGFGPDLRFRELSPSRKWSNILALPLGSGVVSYRSYIVHLSTCSSFPVGVRTSDSLCRNFWWCHRFWPKLP
jgi:hypothetical protein